MIIQANSTDCQDAYKYSDSSTSKILSDNMKTVSVLSPNNTVKEDFTGELIQDTVCINGSTCA